MDEDQVEDVLLENCCFKVPSAICVDPEVFKSVFSVETFENLLGPEQKQRILQFLPKEVLSNPELTSQTIQDLFSGGMTRFGCTPLETLFSRLNDGIYQPEIVKQTKTLKKLWQKDSERIKRRHYVKVHEDIFLLRQNPASDPISKLSNGVGSDAYSFVPSPTLRLQNGELHSNSTIGHLQNDESKRRKRYHDEILAINKESGCTDDDDEEVPVAKKPTQFTLKLNKVFEVTPSQGSKLNKTQPAEKRGGPSVKPTSISASSNSKPASRPASKVRQEQTAAKLAKFPKILPAPPPSSSTCSVKTSGASRQGSQSVQTTTSTSVKTVDPSKTNKAPGVSTTSQQKSSPLLASQLLAPPAYKSATKHQRSRIETGGASSSTRPSSSACSAPSSYVGNFERPEDDDAESSSEDEFESAEPPAFASNLLPNTQLAKSAKGSRQPTKLKPKSNTKSSNQPQNHPVASVNRLTSTTSTSTPSIAQTTTTTILSASSTPTITYVRPFAATNLVDKSAGANVGVLNSASTQSPTAVRLSQPHIIFGTSSTLTNPVTMISSPSAVTYTVQTNSNVIQSLLTPKMVTQPISDNSKLLPSTVIGVTQASDAAGSSGTPTVIPLQTIQSSSFNSSIKSTSTTNSNFFVINGPLSTGITTEGAKSSAVAVQVNNGVAASATSARVVNTIAGYMNPQMSSGISTTLSSGISLKDLNLTLNPKYQEINSLGGQESKDSLALLDMSMDIPNLSDELEGLDGLDLVEVCDFSSLVSEDKRYASFFSLIRDILCSTRDHRMTYACLEATIRRWSGSASAKTNEWFDSMGDWNEALSTGLHFLAGNYQDAHPEEFVPYIEYKYKTKYYQWIGAGRDNDNNLIPLCNLWLENINRLPPIKKLEGENEEHDEEDEENEDSDGPEVEVKKKVKRPQTPPPPRCTTSWTVRASSKEEREYFQQQEKQRFENPHKAFTYRMHEYESVVGPVKGVYSSQTGMTNKARGHSLLIDDRPPYVTILALVRDAVARLPNGEGTRSEICEMLRDSAFLNPDASSVTLNSVVSGALDRLHYERDPCVRYDSHKKNWIYLHRDRNQDQFERLHHNRSYTKSTKSRSNSSRKSRKHNKSTSSSGSQSQGTSPASSQSPSGSGSIVPTTAIVSVKLPPIETVMNKTGPHSVTSSLPLQTVVQNNNILRISSQIPQFDSVASYPQSHNWQMNQKHILSDAQSAASTIPTSSTITAVQGEKLRLETPILSSIIKGAAGVTSNVSIPSNAVISSSPQLTKSAAQTNPIIFTPNSALRFVNQLNAGNQQRLTSARGLQTSTIRSGNSTAPAIVLRGSIPGQNSRQPMLIMQGGQAAIILSAGSGAGTAQLHHLNSTSTGQSQPASSVSLGSVLSIAPPSTSVTSASTSTAGILHLGVNKTAVTQNTIGKGPMQVSVNAEVISKLLAAAGATSAVPNTMTMTGPRVLTQQLPHQGIGVPQPQVGSLAVATNASGKGIPTNPVVLRSDQSGFIRLVCGPGDVKLIPISGQSNQPVIARLVAQPQSQVTTSASVPPTPNSQVSTSGQANSSGQPQYQK